MTKFRIELNQARCQSYNKCAATAPGVFELDENRKVRLADHDETSDDAAVKAARSCPYRVITIIDSESGELIFPTRRR
jgi:ferredoxin